MNYIASQPLITVLLPTFNGEQFIAEAIESALRQTYSNREIVVIDDGSKDNTAALVKSRFGEKVKLLTQANAGKSAAINLGAAQSTGRYMALLDDDDRWLPEKLELQLRLALSDSRIGVVGGGAYFINASGEPISSPEPVMPEVSYEMASIKASIPGIGTNILFSREVFDRIGGFDPLLRRCQDIEFVRSAAKVSRVVNVMQPTVEVRQYPRPAPDLKLIKHCREQILARIDDPTVARKARAWFYFRHSQNLAAGGRRIESGWYKLRSYLTWPGPIASGAERAPHFIRRLFRVMGGSAGK